ncbi:MAG: RidA family protein [Planctomycetota bacterium]
MPQFQNRRSFLRTGMPLIAGIGAGALAPWIWLRHWETVATANVQVDKNNVEQRIKDLGLELPPPAKPVAVYVPAVITGNLLYTAGHIPWLADGKMQVGRVGSDLTVEQGAAAARLVGLQILTTLRQALGNLDRVSRLVKVLGMVNCTPDFTQQPKVINGFSELMVQVFGEQAGKGARSAVGMGSLPGNTPVEIEAIFEIRPS